MLGGIEGRRRRGRPRMRWLDGITDSMDVSLSELREMVMTREACYYDDFPVAQTVKRLPTMWETRVRSLGWEDPLEKAMAPHSSTLAWKIPWMEELGAGYCPWIAKSRA